MLYADGNLYFRYEDGLMALIQATPEAYGRAQGTIPHGGEAAVGRTP